jgi:hypothetical protein
MSVFALPHRKKSKRFRKRQCSLTGWNQIVAELREWEKIKQAFNLAL